MDLEKLRCEKIELRHGLLLLVAESFYMKASRSEEDMLAKKLFSLKANLARIKADRHA